MATWGSLAPPFRWLSCCVYVRVGLVHLADGIEAVLCPSFELHPVHLGDLFVEHLLQAGLHPSCHTRSLPNVLSRHPSHTWVCRRFRKWLQHTCGAHYAFPCPCIPLASDRFEPAGPCRRLSLPGFASACVASLSLLHARALGTPHVGNPSARTGLLRCWSTRRLVLFYCYSCLDGPPLSCNNGGGHCAHEL